MKKMVRFIIDETKRIQIETNDYRTAGNIVAGGFTREEFDELCKRESEEGHNVITFWNCKYHPTSEYYAYPCDIHEIYPDAIMEGCEAYEEGRKDGR